MGSNEQTKKAENLSLQLLDLSGMFYLTVVDTPLLE